MKYYNTYEPQIGLSSEWKCISLGQSAKCLISRNRNSDLHKLVAADNLRVLARQPADADNSARYNPRPGQLNQYVHWCTVLQANLVVPTMCLIK